MSNNTIVLIFCFCHLLDASVSASFDLSMQWSKAIVKIKRWLLLKLKKRQNYNCKAACSFEQSKNMLSQFFCFHFHYLSRENLWNIFHQMLILWLNAGRASLHSRVPHPSCILDTIVTLNRVVSTNFHRGTIRKTMARS